MYVRKEPKSSNKNPMKLSDVFSNKDNSVFPIKSDLQRRYCWTSNEIDTLISQYFVDMYLKNKESDNNGENPFYGTIGDGIVCKPHPNWMNTNCESNELVDMSQRITTVTAISMAALYLHMLNEDIMDINERQLLMESYFKTKNKESFRVETTFKDCEIKSVYNDIVNNTFSFSKKDVQNACKLFQPCKKGEVVYKPFSKIVRKVYDTITSLVDVNDVNMKEWLDSFLDNTYLQIEVCEYSERVAKFREVNSYRIGVADTDIYKSLLCAKGDSIDDLYQEMEENIRKISETVKDKGYVKRINILKAPYTITEYIMKLALICISKDEKICKFDFTMSDAERGIEWQLENENGCLNTEEKVLTFIKKCIHICEFLSHSMDFKTDDFTSDWYLFTEGRNRPFIWLYNILPCYLISQISNADKKEYAFNMLLRSYLAYSLKYSTNRSVQYIQNYMFTFALKLIKFEEKSYEVFKNELDVLYNDTFSKFISEELNRNMVRLAYGEASSLSAIRGILSYFEYEAQKRSGEKNKNLYRFSCGEKDAVEIEHIKPKSEETDDNSIEIHGIGNLTLLESTLNSAKCNNAEKTSNIYNASTFITTKLMINNARLGNLTNNHLDELRGKSIPEVFDVDEINSFNEDDIKRRRTKMVKMVRDFLTISE